MASRVWSIHLFHLEKDALIEYVKKQEEHHKIFSFIDEYRALLKEHDVEFDEKYLL